MSGPGPEAKPGREKPAFVTAADIPVFKKVAESMANVPSDQLTDFLNRFHGMVEENYKERKAGK